MTYAEIQKVYPISKGLLSYWFNNAGLVRDREKQLEDLKRDLRCSTGLRGLREIGAH